MNIYALLVVLILISAVVFNGNQPKSLKFVIVASLLMFAVLGLRDATLIGVDTTSSYRGVFLKMSMSSWSEVLEAHRAKNTGFYLMTKAFSEFISNDYQTYITVLAAFVSLCFGRLIYRYSPSPLQSILYHFGLLLYMFQFSALKQCLAMSILMLAFDPLIERKPIKFILLVLLAGQFHMPALVFLPSYWLTKIQPGKKYLILLGVVLVLTYLFRNQLLNLMNSLYGDEEEAVDLSGVQFLRTKALIMVIIVAAAVFFRVPTPEDKTYSSLFVLMCLAIIFQTFCGYDNTFERLADYFFQFSVIFLALVFDRRAYRKGLFNWRFAQTAETVAPILFCSFGVYRFLDYISSNAIFFLPYRFFFQS